MTEDLFTATDGAPGPGEVEAAARAQTAAALERGALTLERDGLAIALLHAVAGRLDACVRSGALAVAVQVSREVRECSSTLGLTSSPGPASPRPADGGASSAPAAPPSDPLDVLDPDDPARGA